MYSAAPSSSLNRNSIPRNALFSRQFHSCGPVLRIISAYWKKRLMTSSTRSKPSSVRRTVAVKRLQTELSASPPLPTPAEILSASPLSFRVANRDPVPSWPMSSSTYSTDFFLYRRLIPAGTVKTRSSCLPSLTCVVLTMSGSCPAYGDPATT